MEEVEPKTLVSECEDFGLAVKLHCKCMQGDLEYFIASWDINECAVLSDETAKVLIDYHSRTCKLDKAT